MKRERKGMNGLRMCALLACVTLFLISSYMVFSQLIVDHRQRTAFESLIEQVSAARANPDMRSQADASKTPAPDVQQTDFSAPAQPAADAAPAQGIDAPASERPCEADSAVEIPSAQGEDAAAPGKPARVPAAAPDATPEPPMLSTYAPLHARNADVFGWIEIEDTQVNYPVMHTPDEPEFYLHRGFDRAEAYSGVPFLSADCFIGCGNYIVFGHNMKNGTQFATIPKYKRESFWEAHPSIRFDTLYETGVYDVVAAFYSQAYPEDAVGVFRYYQYSDLREEERFAEYAEQVKAAALYETGIELAYGDELLTLSTCEYHRTDGRFVIVARKREGATRR